MVQIFMRDLKKVSTLWSVGFRVSALERFCYKGFLRNSYGTKYFVSREAPLYHNKRNACLFLKKQPTRATRERILPQFTNILKMCLHMNSQQQTNKTTKNYLFQ